MGCKKKFILYVVGVIDIFLYEDCEVEFIKFYFICMFFYFGFLGKDFFKWKIVYYKFYKIGFFYKGENFIVMDFIWDEMFEWEYDDVEVFFLCMLIKSDDSWVRNLMFVVVVVRLQYIVFGWIFVFMLDMKGYEMKCMLLVKFEMVDVQVIL